MNAPEISLPGIAAPKTALECFDGLNHRLYQLKGLVAYMACTRAIEEDLPDHAADACGWIARDLLNDVDALVARLDEIMKEPKP